MRTALVSAVGLALVVLAGCQSNPEATDFNSIKSNLTPELQTLTQRPVDVDRAVAVTANEDFRMMWMDLGRQFYLDRPSSLAPYYIVPTGGTPR
ncbi:MAG: hypothetical protein U0572_14355 [Phycisphaerales bacterium]